MCSRVTLEIITWIFDTIDTNLKIRKDHGFNKIFKWGVVCNVLDNIFPSNILPNWLKIACKITSKLSDCFNMLICYQYFEMKHQIDICI